MGTEGQSAMLITLSPQRRDDRLTIERKGDVLIVNGTPVDLSSYDANSKSTEWFVDRPVQEEGTWHVNLILPHGPIAPKETRFPESLRVSEDGPIMLPPYGEVFDEATTPHQRDVAIEFPSPRPAPFDAQAAEYHHPMVLGRIQGAKECVADTIAYYAAADTSMRIFMLGSFGANIVATDALTYELRRDDALDIGLRVAVSTRNRPDMEAAVNAFLSARSKIKQFRDKFAHGQWAARSDMPDHVLLSGSNQHRKAHARFFAALQTGEFDQFRPDFEAWAVGDFHRAREATIALLNAAQGLSTCFAGTAEEVDSLRSELEQQGLLRNPPHIRKNP